MTDAPGSGHNRPELDPFQRADDLVENANKWLKERPKIESEEQAGACQLAIDQLLRCKEDLEAARDAERQPLDLAIAAIVIRYRQPLTLVGIAIMRLRDIAAQWLVHKRDVEKAAAAKREAEAERLRTEANLAIERAVTDPSIEADLAAQQATKAALDADKAADRGPKRQRIKGDYATKAMSLREHWYAEVVDPAKALRSFATHPDVRQVALAKALQLAGVLAREKKREDAAPPGFRFFKRETAL